MRRCAWCEGPREALRMCDAPRAAGPFCSTHAVRGLIRRRIAADLEPTHVGADLWPMEERPTARQRAADTEQRQRQRAVVAAQRQRDEAVRRIALLRFHIADARAAGAATASQIADRLNEAGVLNAKGEPWSCVSMAMVLHRLARRQQRQPQRQPEALAQAA